MKPSRIIAGALAALSAAFLTLPAAAEDGNLSSITQIGAGQTANVRQKFVASGGLGKPNLATVTQTGAANSMDITQEGNALTALVTQNGNDNTGAIRQYGAGHTADVIQNGNGHGVNIVQDNIYGASVVGPGSTVIVHQY